MYLYGLHAALLMGICVAVSVVTEAVLSLILHRGWTILDYSAVVTGLIGGMLLPARAPYYYAVILALVAAISKAAFGGIGRNWLNPAGLGKLVLLIAFHSTMVDYTGGEYGAVGALTLLRQGEEMTLGNMLLGHTAGPIGTGSAVTILIGAAFLLLIGITDIYIPIAYLAAFSVFWVIFGGYGLSPYQLAVQFAGGSTLFTAFIMAQDNTTSPMSREGKLVYGAILGLLTGILRRFGILENSALIALLIGNLSVRWLDTKTFPAIFGVDATVRRISRDRRRRRDRADKDQTAEDSVSGYQEFEEHVVPKGAMDGSETAGTINEESIESFNNRRAVTYDTASLDPASVRRELERQGHAMQQSMPIFGEPAEPEHNKTGRRRSDVQPEGSAVPEQTIPQPEVTQTTQAMPPLQDYIPQPDPVPMVNYGIPTYPNGQPMVDLNGNPMPLLDEYGNPMLDEYGNMIWGQPMQMPYMQPYAPTYGTPMQGMPAMPVYGQAADYNSNMGYADAQPADEPGRKAVTDEPVSRDTDMLEVAKILEAARAMDNNNGDSALKDVQYMDLSSGFSSPEIQQKATRLEHKSSGRRSKR